MYGQDVTRFNESLVQQLPELCAEFFKGTLPAVHRSRSSVGSNVC